MNIEKTGDMEPMKLSPVWADEFNYEGPPDPAKWVLESGGHGWGNRELQYYTDRADAGDANAYVKGGKLIITVRREDFGGLKYTSARMHSLASWKYGRLDVSAKLPSGNGTWPAIWMLGDAYREVDWPACGEIDVMEHVGRRQNILGFSLHSKLHNHRNKSYLTQSLLYPGVSDGFHVYTLDWEEDRISILIDGMKAVEWRNGDGGRDTGPDAWPFNAPFFLILNLAYGGVLGGPPDENRLPLSMEIEYVRVYQRG